MVNQIFSYGTGIAIALLTFASPSLAISFDFSQKLMAPDGALNDHFGHPLAVHGNYALVGAKLDDDHGSWSGSAYLFDLTTGDLLHKLTAPDGASEDFFAHSVALNDNYALVGSAYDDDNGPDTGSAYLFDLTTGNLLHKLTAPDGTGGEFFGRFLDIDENYALISADHDNDKGVDSGSAYLFDLTTGDLLHKLTAPDGVSRDFFGSSVAIDGNYALIGAAGDEDDRYHSGSATTPSEFNSGSAYLFDVTTGDFLQKLIAPDGMSRDFFGDDLALDGNNILIGAYGNDENGSNSGAVYLFQPPSSVPEPSSILGLLAIAGLAMSSLLKGKGN